LGLTLLLLLLPVSTRNNPLAGHTSPLLCYVTDRRSLAAANPAEPLAELTHKIAEIAAAGIDWVQIREKDLTIRDLASLTRQSLRIAKNVAASRFRPIRVLLNDRLDVAISERADGVHLGERSLPVGQAKRLIQSVPVKQTIRESFLAGVSCHSLEAAQQAERDGADYIFFGPVFATPSKAIFGAPQGLDRLAQVCRSVSIPVLAIGGITSENATACRDAGAAGLAAIRMFQDARHLSGVVAAVRQAFNSSQ
jgi:thiamine-phosphate pyrophosphorylase